MTANLMEYWGLAGGPPGTVTSCAWVGAWKPSAAPGSPAINRDRRLTSYAIVFSPGSDLIHMLNEIGEDGVGIHFFSTSAANS